jgi:hypothetical protein
MLNKEEVHQWCRERGYELHSRSGGDESRHYSKHFDKFFLSLSIHFESKNMVLQGFPGLFTLSTGNLQVMHPRFDDLFEKRMVQMMSAIENDND